MISRDDLSPRTRRNELRVQRPRNASREGHSATLRRSTRRRGCRVGGGASGGVVAACGSPACQFLEEPLISPHSPDCVYLVCDCPARRPWHLRSGRSIWSRVFYGDNGQILNGKIWNRVSGDTAGVATAATASLFWDCLTEAGDTGESARASNGIAENAIEAIKKAIRPL